MSYNNLTIGSNEYFRKIINVIYQFIFKKSINNKEFLFIKNISFISIGGLVSSVFLFLVNFTASRWYGPSEYGKYSMVIYLSNFLVIPMIVGINTSLVNHLSKTKESHQRNILKDNALAIVVIFSIISTFTIFLLVHPISQFFNISQPMLIVGTIYCLFLTFKLFCEAYLKGNLFFIQISKLEIATSIIVFLAFFFQKQFNTTPSYIYLTVSLTLGLSTYVLISFIHILKNFSFFNLNFSTINKLLSYSKFAILGSVSGLIMGNVDKLILNRTLGFQEIGLYSVYLNASTIFSSIFFPLFLVVFFPTMSQISNKKNVLSKIVKIFTVIFLPTLFLNIISIFLYIYLLGQNYQLNYYYIILFSFQNITFLLANTLWWLLNSIGSQGIKFSSITGIPIGILNIILSIVLTKYFGVTGVITSSIITSSLMIYIARYKILSQQYS